MARTRKPIINRENAKPIVKFTASRLIGLLLRWYTAANFSPNRVTTQQFLADRTNGRAIATLLRLSSVRRPSVCDVMYCG